MESVKREYYSILILLKRLLQCIKFLIPVRLLKTENDSHLLRNLAAVSMLLFTGISLSGQDYEIDAYNGLIVNTCTGTFYDSGGLLASYSNNEDYTVTFSATAGNIYRFDFTNFSVRSGDALYVYDGPNTGSPLIGTYYGTASPWNLPDFSVYSTGTSLTFNFKSNNDGFTRPGWIATINCLSCPPITPPVILPSVTEACAGSTVNYSVDAHAGSIYTWTIDKGTPTSVSGPSNTLAVTWDLPGLTTGRVKVEELWACGTKVSSELYVDIYPLPSPLISGAADVCPNASGVSYSTPLVVGNSYNWIVTGGTYSGSGNSILVNWGATGPGTVQVTEIDPALGCSAVSPVYTVLIQDIVPPVITGCPANINLNNNPGTCSNTATWTEPAATDICDGVVAFTTRSHAPGSTFNAGTTVVTYTFTDAAGNTSVCTFNVTVTDTENPVALCKNITVMLGVGGTVTITGADVDNGSSDNCGIGSLAVLPNSFNSSNIGANNVTLTVTDNSGNSAACNAVVTVLDNTPPVALCKDITVFLDAGGSVTITGGDVDNGSNDPDGIASLTVSPNNFTCLNIGPNTVTLTVTDNAGKISTCNSTVTVLDNTLPVISCPGNYNIGTNPGICGAVVNYITPVGTDNCAGSITTQTAGLASGSVFPVGTTINTFLVTDPSGNTATCSFSVIVSDNIAPVITLPVPPVIAAGPGCQAPIPVIAATFSDNCTPAGSIIVSQVPAAGTIVGTGITAVTITATDLSGNTANSSINVTVVDATSPVITTPADIILNLDNNCQAPVADFLGSLVVTDNCTAPGAIIKTQTPAAGTIITGVTSTNILIEATDASGNKSSVTVLFITADIIPPVVVCKNATLYLDGTGNATLTASAIDNGSNDNCTAPLNFTLSKSAFSCSDIGAPVSVTLTGRDASLNTASCISQVTVLDTVKPVVNVKTFNLILGPTGTGTLLPSDVDNGSFDNCGPITLTVAPNTFNCGNQGTRTVTLTALDTHGNTRSKNVNITVSSSLSIDAISLSSCDLVGPFARYGSTVNGGNGVYSYFWDGLEDAVNPFVYFDFIPPFIHFVNTSNDVSPFYNNLMPDGTYNIRLIVTDGNGCKDTLQMVLVKNAGLVFNNVTLKNSTACENEIKNYSVAAGATSYTWSIINGTFLSPTNTNSVTVQWGTVSPGTLVATITKPDLLGNPCTSSVEETVTINPVPVPAFNAPVLSVCSGSEYTYTLTSTFISHSWTVTNGTITGGGTAGDNYVNVKWGAFAAGTVAVNVTNGSGCSNSVSANITINSVPVPTLTSSDADNTFCIGTIVIFTAGGGNSYDFRVNSVSVQNGPLNTYTTNSLSNGQVVDVIVTNASGCSATSAGITNIVNAIPAPALTSSDADNRFCEGTSVVFTASGGTNFDFRVNTVVVQSGASPTFTTSALTNGQIVDVIVTNAGGCSAVSPGIANIVDPYPVPTLVSSEPTNSFCFGTTVTFTAGGGINYNFRINNITVQNGASDTYTSNSIANGDVVDVIVTNAGSCSATSAGITNTVVALPVATLISSDADNMICAGTSVTFTAGGGTNYIFRVNGSIVQNSALSAYTTTTLLNGQVVDVIVSNASGCSSTSAGIATVVTTLPTATISYAGSPYCSTTGGGQAVTLTGSPGGTYSALPAGLSIDNITGAVNPGLSIPNTYTVSYTIPAAGGCGPVIATATVVITPVPVATFSYSGTPYCSNAVNPMPAFSGGGIAGTFSANPAGLVFVSASTGQIDLTASSPGNYLVTNTIPAGGGCGIVTASSPVTITTLPTASILYSGTTFCNSVAAPQAVTLTGTGNYTGGTFSSTPGLSINSSTGEITPSLSAPATYTVTYTIAASGGCSAVVATTNITIAAVPVPLFTVQPGANICVGASATYTTQAAQTNYVWVVPGTAGTDYNITSGGLGASDNTVTLIWLTTGPKTVTVNYTSADGCTGVLPASNTTTVNFAPTPTIAGPSPVCIGTTGNVYTTEGGKTNYVWTVSAGGSITAGGGATDNSVTVTWSSTGAQSVSINYTDGGCAAASPTLLNVNVNPANTIALSSPLGTDNQSICIGAPILTINYITSGATGANFIGFPGGLVESYIGNLVTITGTPTETGVFNYSVTLSGGCGTVIATGVIRVNGINTISLSSGLGTNAQTLCINTPVTNITYATTGATGATFSGLPGGVTGSWAGNVVTITGTPSVSGPFNYTVTLTGGCGTVTANGTINVTEDNTISLSSGPGTDAQTLCLSTPITNITYSTTGATGATFSGLPGGVTGSWAGNVVTITGTPSVSGPFNYTVTLTGGCGIVTANGTITVNVDNTISLSSGPGTDAQTLCINTPLTDITYATTGATGASFSGLPAGVTGSLAGNVVTITGTPSVSGAFNYTVTLTGGCGTATANGTITVTEDNTISLSSGVGTDAQTLCISIPITDITYTTTGATGATFSGLPGGVTGSWAGNVVNITGTPTAAGISNYTVTLTGGCGTVTANGTITVNANNSISLSSGLGTNAQTLCINTPITDITYATTGATGASFSGLPAGVTGSWAGNVVTITGTPSVAGPFNYTVTLTGGCGLAASNGTINVTPDNTITRTSAAGTDNQTICFGASIVTITYTTTGATGAIFTGLPGGMSFTFAGNTVTINGTPSALGVYNYSVDLTGGCGTVGATGTITVSSDNTISLTSGPGSDNLSTCIGSPMADITYSTTGATGATFAGLPAGVTGTWAANVVTISGTPSATGINNYTITLTGGCGTATANGIINVIAENAINLSSAAGTDNQVLCNGTPIVDITYTTTGGTGAIFSGLPGGVTGSWAAGVATISGLPTVTGSFAYTVTLTGGCGIISANGTITVNSIPLLVINDPAAVCSPVTIDLTATAVTSGSDPGLIFTYWTDVAATIPYATPAAATDGTYYIKGTAASGCSDIKLVIATVNPSPAVSTAVTDVLCTGASTGAIDLTVTGGTAPFTFLWSNAAVTEDITDVPAGGYSVTVTDSKGCTANASLNISEPAAALSATTVSTDVSCLGSGSDGSVDLSVSGGVAPYTFLWSNGATTEDISGLPAGTYTVLITDANSCTAPATGIVLGAGESLIISPAVTNVSCFGDNNGAIDLTVVGGTAPYTYLWSNGPVTEDISGLAPGTYTVIVNDNAGCTKTVLIDVTQPAAALAGTAVPTDVLCFGGSTGTVNLTVTGGTAPYSFLWNSGAVTEDLAGIAAANYNVTITDANGCTASASATVAQPAAPLAGSTAVTNVLCNGGSTGAIDITVTGGTAPYNYLWSNSAATEDVTGLTIGTYTVRVTDAKGCQINLTADITQPPALAIEETHTDARCPDEMTGSITITVTGGVQPYNIIWSDGQSTLTRAAEDTTYTVVVTDANGCAAGLDITVGFSDGSSCVKVNQVITPNGDGKNDVWMIKNIELYPDAELLIYNRWGKLIYKTKNISANPWDGKDDGKLVPTDSYHYILYINDGSEPRTGTITVVR